MYHFDVSQADYYNIEFTCSSKKMLTNFLVSCIFLGDLFYSSMSLYTLHFLFVYGVPLSSMDDVFCNLSQKFAA